MSKPDLKSPWDDPFIRILRATLVEALRRHATAQGVEHKSVLFIFHTTGGISTCFNGCDCGLCGVEYIRAASQIFGFPVEEINRPDDAPPAGHRHH